MHDKRKSMMLLIKQIGSQPHTAHSGGFKRLRTSLPTNLNLIVRATHQAPTQGERQRVEARRNDSLRGGGAARVYAGAGKGNKSKMMVVHSYCVVPE